MSNIVTVQIYLYDKCIGTITQLPGDRNFFAFDQDYIDDPDRPMLSLSFREALGGLVTEIKTTRTRLPPFFSNLLPEGLMRELLAERLGLNPEREFLLLSALGEDLPGAVRVRGSVLSDRIEHKVNRHEEERPLRFSLAGVQLKFSAMREGDRLTIPAKGMGGEWIIKLPSRDYVGVPENEFVMMELARRMGMEVPETALFPIEKVSGLPKGMERLGPHAFVIKRFDRKGKERVHTEDFAQVFNLYPEKKYRQASYRNIVEVILAEMGEEGVKEFMRRFVFSALIGNGDMHLKNWSLIYRDRRRAELAPVYDFVSTVRYIPEEGLALNFVGSKAFSDLSLQQFERFSEKGGLSWQHVKPVVEECIEQFVEVWKTVEDLPIDPELKQSIDAHLERLPIWHNRR